MRRYWFATCPNCNHQGRLIVMKNLTTNQLYLHCEECEYGWRDPKKVNDPAAKFLTLDEDFEAELATWNDIEEAGWQPYSANFTDE